MANCTKCGAAVAEDSAFCGSCGQPVKTQASASVATSSSVAGGPAAAAAGTTAPSGTIAGGAGLTMNLAAALSYALGLITGILFLVLEPYKNNKFVRFHAMQSILFSVACVIFAIVWGILWGILTSVAGFWILSIDVPLTWLIWLGVFCFWLFLMFQAYSQREYRLPWIGDIAAKQVG
ncbi:MAG: zinc-ribbon domain-containing protein [Candidatus Acidiferrales bacterium]